MKLRLHFHDLRPITDKGQIYARRHYEWSISDTMAIHESDALFTELPAPTNIFIDNGQLTITNNQVTMHFKQ